MNDYGKVLEILNNKSDVDFINATPTSTFAQALLNAGIDTVVARQEPTSANNYTWYRKYKSGWVEQGGCVNTASGTVTVNFPITMSDSNYTILKTMDTSSSNAAQYNSVSFYSKTTTGATTTTSGVGFSWQVSGMAA